MNINRHNYESFFLLYVDHELTAAEQKAVEEFVQQNPDLEKELSLLQQSVFPPDDQASFAGKEQLFKGEPTQQAIHAGNYVSPLIPGRTGTAAGRSAGPRYFGGIRG